MKKALLLVTTLLLVFGMAIGLAGCKKEEPQLSYSLDSTGFVNEVIYGDTLSLDGLVLVEAGGSTVAVTADMVSGIDTTTAGENTLTVSYNGQTFEAKYTVKFKVTFMVNGQETVQYVTNAAQIVLPEIPTVPGKQFDRWSVDIPNVLTSNIRIDAIYKTLSSEREDVYTWSGSGIINLDGYAETGASVSVSVTDVDGNALSSVATLDSAANKISYTLPEGKTVIISISGSGVIVPKSWKIEKTDAPTVTLAEGDALAIRIGSNRTSQKINMSSTPIKFKYVTEISNTNIDAAASSGYLFIDVMKMGVTKIEFKAVNSTNELEYITLTQYVVITPAEIIINNNTTVYGIEDIWTVGRENASALPKLTLSFGDVKNVGEGFYENLKFVTGNDNVTVSDDGTITLAKVSSAPDIVNIVAVFGYGNATVQSAPMKVRCVYNGVNVYKYSELWIETLKADPRPIVLQNNIKDDFSATNFSWINSTYDLTYHYNVNASAEDMKIKVLLQFKDDVYGNGYEINADNATIGSHDASGNPTSSSLFGRGPLNFVSMTQTGGAISVKAQDNIAFAVYENVTLNNVVLKSCDPEEVDGMINLADLEYAGTTVEVLGDNVTIEYSRIMNGRTVLRVFGDYKDASKVINVTVKNSVLKGSREFIARIGTNYFVFDEDVASPLLPGDSGSDYNTKKNYNKLSEEKQAEYDSKYIKTFVTFENVVFEDAGIFAIGLDSHFAGEALRDGSRWYDGALKGWKDLAKTSYGAKVILEDDVRLYNWKTLDSIDSSTLMENNLTTGSFADMDFNVRAIIEAAVEKYPDYSKLLYEYNGKKYIHAGIAFFGGGKNYSVVENNMTSSEFNHAFSEYSAGFETLGSLSILKTAAGSEPFYFYIYDNGSTFKYSDQINMKDKYSCLYN